MDLFEFIKVIFNRDAKWSSIKTYDKSKNFFMLNRFMSINFPTQSNLFNNRFITSSSAIDSWRDVLNRLYTKPPGWMYTKTKKKDAPGPKKYPEKATIQEWIKLNKLSKKDFDSMIENMQEETLSELIKFEKILKEKNNGI
jgi:hypothetical protein